MKALAEQEPLLIFRVGPVMCCAPVRDVDSIVIPQALNYFPGQAPDVAGVFQYRSHTVSVHKLHTKFGLPELEDQSQGRIIMAYTHHGLTGFWADEIEEITSGYEAHWSSPPGFVDGNIFDKTLLWREKLLLHTDFDRLFAMRDAAPLTIWIAEHGDELSSENNPDIQVGSNESTVSDETSNVVNLSTDSRQEDASSVASAREEVDDEMEGAQEIYSADTDTDTETETEAAASDQTGEEEIDATTVTDKTDLEGTEESEFTLDQGDEVEEVEFVEENSQLQEREPASGTDEVDESLYYQALDALQPDTDVASSVIQDQDVDLCQDKQAHIEQVESGEISTLLSKNIDDTQNDDRVERFIEKSEAIVEAKSDPIELEPVVDNTYQVEPIEPIISEPESNVVVSHKGAETDLSKNEMSSYKMIGGVSALIVVAAIGGYVIFGGDERVEQTVVPIVAEAEISTLVATPIAEIIAPDEMADSAMDAADSESDSTHQPALQTLEEVVEAEFNKSLQSNSGAIGSTNTKQDTNITEDKPQDMVPIKTTIVESPLKPLEPQLPVWGVHVVSKGDTLWHLAALYLNNPFRYVELANWSDIKNPDRIYPGENVKYKEEK